MSDVSDYIPDRAVLLPSPRKLARLVALAEAPARAHLRLFIRLAPSDLAAAERMLEQDMEEAAAAVKLDKKIGEILDDWTTDGQQPATLRAA